MPILPGEKSADYARRIATARDVRVRVKGLLMTAIIDFNIADKVDVVADYELVADVLSEMLDEFQQMQATAARDNPGNLDRPSVHD